MPSHTVYNEIDAYAAEWLRNLVKAGVVAKGTVDTRSVTDLTPKDVRGATQAHFFAGIGVWSSAARAAGWPDDQPLWTGSCPCQPFSQEGKGHGTQDPRHLWPAWYRLVKECSPPVVVGEQVASPAGLQWLDSVFSDLESQGYACAAANTCAAGVGAPHARQRLYFVALGHPLVSGLEDRLARWAQQTQEPCTASRLGPKRPGPTPWDGAVWDRGQDGNFRPTEPGTRPLAHGPPTRVGRLRAYGNALVLPQATAFLAAVRDAVFR